MAKLDASQIQTLPRTHAEISNEVFQVHQTYNTLWFSERADSLVQALIWTFVAVTFAFLAARLTIRIRIFHRLMWDDGFVILAWCLYVAHCLIWKFCIHYVYDMYKVLGGGKLANPKLLDEMDRFLTIIVAETILFYSALFAVKFSLLAFFYNFSRQLRGHRNWWWCVVAVTAISYVACVADNQYACTTVMHSVDWIIREFEDSSGWLDFRLTFPSSLCEARLCPMGDAHFLRQLRSRCIDRSLEYAAQK
jgi:uncharacterized membrane protein